jgi:hypothetical protein
MKKIRDMEKEHEGLTREDWGKAQQLKYLRVRPHTELKHFKDREGTLHIRKTNLKTREAR